MVIEFFGHHCAGKTSLHGRLSSALAADGLNLVGQDELARRILYGHYAARGWKGRILAASIKKNNEIFRVLDNDRIYPGFISKDKVNGPLAVLADYMLCKRRRLANSPIFVNEDFQLLRSLSLRHALSAQRIEVPVLLDESVMHRVFVNAILDEQPFYFARDCIDIGCLPDAAILVHETADIIRERINQRQYRHIELYGQPGVPEKAVDLCFSMRDQLLSKGVPVFTIQPTADDRFLELKQFIMAAFERWNSL